VDEETFEKHFFVYAPYVRLMANRYFTTYEDQEDFVQEVWLHIYKYSGGYDKSLNIAPKKWVTNVVRWVAYDIFDKRNRKIKTVANIEYDFTEGGRVGADRQDHTRLLLEMSVKHCRHMFNHKQFAVLNMLYLGYSGAGIAELLGVSRQAVNQQVKKIATIIKNHFDAAVFFDKQKDLGPTKPHLLVSGNL